MGLLILTAALVLGADKVPPAARVELATAQALVSAGQLTEAITALERAEKLAPAWHEVPLLRARLRVQQLGKSAELIELLKPEEETDYAGILGGLKRAAADYELVFKRAAGHPDEAVWAGELGQVRARITAAEKSAVIIGQRRDEAKLLDQAEQLRQQSEAQEAAERTEAERQRQALLKAQQAERERAAQAARTQAEEERRIASEHRRVQAEATAAREAEERRVEGIRVARQEAVDSRAGARSFGIVLIAVGAAAGGGAGAFAGLGLDVNARVKAGNFATGADLARAGAAGQNFNLGAYACLGVGGAALGVGLLLLLTHLGEPPPLTVGFNGQSVEVRGSW